jgi:spore germination protein GerM
MSAYQRPSLLSRAGLVLWGLFTLGLLFVVVLLARQLAAAGVTPLSVVGADAPPSATASADEVAQDVATKDVALYFGDPDGRLLSAEIRSMELTRSTAENCRKAIQELIAGPTAPLTPILPDATRIRGLFLLPGGELVVDFSRELAAGRRWSASTEALLVYGLANTLTQRSLRGDDDKTVSKVRILLEGTSPHTFYTGHLDLSKAYGPDASWIRTGVGNGSDNG